MSRRYRERSYLTGLLTSPTAAKDLRSLNLGPVLVARYRAENTRWIEELTRVLRRATLVSALFAVAGALALAAGYAWLASTAGRPGRGGDVAAAITGFALLSDQLDAVLSAYAGIGAYTPFVARLQAFLASLENTTDATPEPVAPRGQSIARLREVSLVYRDGTVGLDGVDLALHPGEWVAVVGVNGSGKSSLVKVLAGLYRPTTGTVLVAGRPATAGDPAVGVLWQDFQLLQYSLLENVLLGRADRLDTPDEATARAELDAAGLAGHSAHQRLGHLDDAAHELSGGQRQRLGLARTAFRDSRLWLLDEPTSALDPEAAARLVVSLRARTEQAAPYRTTTPRST